MSERDRMKAGDWYTCIDDELEGLEIGFTGIERIRQQHLDLAVGRLRTAGQKQRLAEDDHMLLLPQVEMPHQHLSVDVRKKLHHLGDANVGHLDVERAGDMQRFAVLHPGKRDVIIRPVSLDRHRDLVLAGTLERPVVGRSHELDHVYRIGVPFEFDITEIHAPPSFISSA